MALESLPKIAPALFSAEQDLIQIYNKKTDTTGVINASLLGGSTPPSGVSGAIQFSNGSAFASDGANLFWDNVNKRLAVGTNTPSSTVDINSNTLNNAMFSVGPSFATGFQIFNTNSTATPVYGIGLNPSYINTRIGFYDTLTFRANGTQIAEMTSSEVRIGSISGARVGIKGSGSTFATTSLLVQNSNGANLLRIRDDGNVYCEGGGAFSSAGIIGTAYGLFGGASYEASASLVCGGTTQGFLPPRMTTTQRDAIVTPPTGLKIYNTTLGTTDTYDGATWQRFGQQTLIKGSGSTSATTSLLVQNSAETTVLRTYDDGSVNIGSQNGIVTLVSGYNNSFVENRLTLYSAATNIRGIYEGGQGLIVSKNSGIVDLYPSSIFSIDSTTQGFLPPRMTDAQIRAIASPAEGLVAYNTTINHLCCYKAGAWVKFNHSSM